MIRRDALLRLYNSLLARREELLSQLSSDMTGLGGSQGGSRDEADAAFDSAKTFFTRDTLNSSLRPAAQEVLGLEYQTGNLSKLVGLEIWAIQIFDPEVRYVPSLDPATGSTVGGTVAPNLQKKGIRGYRTLLSDSAYTYFNMEDPVVGGYKPENIALRRAIGLAMDIDREIRLLRRGMAIPAQSAIVPHTTDGCCSASGRPGSRYPCTITASASSM